MKVHILAEIEDERISHVIGVFANIQDAEETKYAFSCVYGRSFLIITKEVHYGEQTQA